MNFASFHFAEPRWLWLAAIGPLLLLALQLYAAHARKRQLARLAAPEFIADLTHSHSPFRRMLKMSSCCWRALASASLWRDRSGVCGKSSRNISVRTSCSR